MSATITDIEIGGTWVDLNTVSGITVGSEFTIQNKRSSWVLLHESSTEPLAAEMSGVYLTDLSKSSGRCTVKSGSLKIWGKTTNGVNSIINIQGA
jgi:hypothetical protein